MANTLGLYPLSAPSGITIPLDIYWPIGTIPINGSSGVAQNSIALGTPAPSFLLIHSKIDAYIQFGAVFGGAPAAGSRTSNGCIFIPGNAADTYIPVYPNEASTFSVWPLASGLLYVVLCAKWEDTRKLAQFSRP